LGPNYVDRGPREDFYGQSALMSPISLSPKGTGVLLEAGTDRTEALIATEVNMDDLRNLRQSSRFRPRQQLHLGNMGPVLADFYRKGLSIEEAIAQDLSGIGEPPSEPNLEPPPVPAPAVEAPSVELPAAEATTAEPPTVEVQAGEAPEPSGQRAVDLSVPEALALTGHHQQEEDLDKAE
jgi:hypothetical protein